MQEDSWYGRRARGARGTGGKMPARRGEPSYGLGKECGIPHSTGVGSNASSRPLDKRGSSPGLRESCARQLVAAVCYRVRSHGALEFLLVQTRGARWIFPKGGVEPGLTQAQSAALEAFEEAGVHGRIEEMPFARYYITRTGRKSGKAKLKARSKSGKSARKTSETMDRGEPVTAHLCEVSYLEPPQEADRNPTWFAPEKAKRRLLEGRSAKFGAELGGLVDRAVARIRRLEAGHGQGSQKDELQQARFEASEGLRLQAGGNAAAMARHLLLKQRRLRAAVLEVKDSPTLH